jgi:hypothetical protein
LTESLFSSSLSHSGSTPLWRISSLTGHPIWLPVSRNRYLSVSAQSVIDLCTTLTRCADRFRHIAAPLPARRCAVAALSSWPRLQQSPACWSPYETRSSGANRSRIWNMNYHYHIVRFGKSFPRLFLRPAGPFGKQAGGLTESSCQTRDIRVDFGDKTRMSKESGIGHN